MGKTEAIIFDFDGTLVDASESIVVSFNAVLTRRGQPVWTRDQILSVMGRPLPEIFLMAFSGNRVPMEELLREYLECSRAPGAAPPRLHAGAAEALSVLALSMKVAIATSRHSESAGRILDLFGLSGHVSAVVGIDHVVRPKPDPEAVHLALRRISADARRTILVGDTPDDMRAARGAGVRAIGVATGWHKPAQLLEAGAERVLPDLTALPGLVA